MTYEDVFRRYDKAIQFNTRLNLNETVDNNENFYVGRQWEGVQANGLSTPVFNVLGLITDQRVATITQDTMAVNVKVLRASPNDEQVRKICSVIQDEIEAIREWNDMTVKEQDMALNAAMHGDGCMFTYWGDNDFPETEIIKNTRVLFGNPNVKDEQKQPYIMINRRETVDAVKDYAKAHGCDDVVPSPDQDDMKSRMDSYSNDKVTVILYMWRDKKTKTIHAIECCRGGVIRKEWDMGLTLYPLVWMPWCDVTDSYHGQAFITGLIPNQEWINKAYAMIMMSMMMGAFPKYIYDKNRIRQWTNAVGAAIGVNGDVTTVARIIEPAQINPQINQILDSVINYTEELNGASAAALGVEKSYNTSAIIANQRASSLPSEIVKRKWQNCIKKWVMVQIDFMASYYGKRVVDIRLAEENEDHVEMLEFAGMKKDTTVQEEFDFSELKNLKLYVGIDVGAGSAWAAAASMQAADTLLQMGQINFEEYAMIIPDGYIRNLDKVLKDRKAKQQAMPKLGGELKNIAAPTEEMAIPETRGNSEMQRAIANSV